MKRMLLVAALMMGGVVASLAMPNDAEARPRRYYSPRANARVYTSGRYYAPRAYYRNYYRSPYYNNYNYGYRGYGYPYYRGYGGYGYGGGVYIGGARGGLRIGW